MEIYLIPGEPGLIRNGVGVLRTSFDQDSPAETVDSFFKTVGELLIQKHKATYASPDFHGVLDAEFVYTGFNSRDQRGKFGLGAFKKYEAAGGRILSAACYYNCGFLYQTDKESVLLQTVEPDKDLVRQAAAESRLHVTTLLVLDNIKYDERAIQDFVKTNIL
jgi:hypothetical protein